MECHVVCLLISLTSVVAGYPLGVIGPRDSSRCPAVSPAIFAVLRILLIQIPLQWVVEGILSPLLQSVLGPNHLLVVVALPGESRQHLRPGQPGGGSFQGTDHLSHTFTAFSRWSAGRWGDRLDSKDAMDVIRHDDEDI